MIPPFNDSGQLPSGVHVATLEETAERFGGSSEIRRAQMDSIRWLVELAKRAGIQRVILNGSFTTDIVEPNDVDCVLVTRDGDPQDALAAEEIRRGLPFLEIVQVEPGEFPGIRDYFATDRYDDPKGMIEVLL